MPRAIEHGADWTERLRKAGEQSGRLSVITPSAAELDLDGHSSLKNIFQGSKRFFLRPFAIFEFSR